MYVVSLMCHVSSAMLVYICFFLVNPRSGCIDKVVFVHYSTHPPSDATRPAVGQD